MTRASSGWHAFATGHTIWFVIVAATWTGALWAAPFDPDYTSGELVDHVESWIDGAALYPDLREPPHRVLNYPPLYPALVRPLAAVGFGTATAGRLVNLVAFLSLLAAVFRWLVDSGCSRREAAALVSLSAASFPIMYSSGQVHVELTAVACTVWGLYLLGRRSSSASTIGATTLLVAACFAKQTQVVFVVLGAVWLVAYDRRRLAGFAGAGLVVGGAAWGVLVAVFGVAPWHHLVEYTVGRFSVAQLAVQLATFVGLWLPVAVAGFTIGWRDAALRRDLRWWYLVGSSVWLLSAARRGSGSQYFIDWSVAVLLVVGPWLVHRSREVSLWAAARTGIGALAALQLVTADAVTAGALVVNLRNIARTGAVLPAICRQLSAPADTPVVIEYPGLARACGAPVAVHPFIMSSLAAQGLWNEAPFLTALAEGRYPRLAVPFDLAAGPTGVHAERWTAGMIATMRRHYDVSDTMAGWSFYRYAR